MQARNEANNPMSWLAGWRVYAVTGSIYLFAILVTDAFFMGDSTDYAESIIAYQNGRYHNFWDFGHLLWRPLGCGITEVLQPMTSWFVGPHPRANVVLTLVWISLATGLLAVICLVKFLSSFCRNGLIISLTTVGFIFSQGILNYAQTGCSYVPGLAFLLLGLCFMTKETMTAKQALITSVAAGFSFAVAIGFWFLFVWGLPAAVLLPLIWHGIERGRVKFVMAVGAFFFAASGLFYLIAFMVLHINTLAAFKDWVLAAGHGNDVRGLARTALGVVRTFVNLGSDGMLMKRLLIGDIYNPVSAWQLALSGLWKVVLYYIFFIMFLWVNRKCINGFKFILLLLATTPIFIFAYFFCPSDIERYLAWYPFFFLMVSYTIEKNPASNCFRTIACLVLVITVISNVQAMFKPTLLRQQDRIASRLGALPDIMPPNSWVLTVSSHDEVVNFHKSFPFHPLNKSDTFRVAQLVVPGLESNKWWRQIFAKRVLETWSQDGQIWISNRILNDRPADRWKWVEGDDKNVSWKEFPEFFTMIKLGRASAGEDGFYEILPTEENKKLLQEIINNRNQSKNQIN